MKKIRHTVITRHYPGGEWDQAEQLVIEDVDDVEAEQRDDDFGRRLQVVLMPPRDKAA